MARCSAFGNAPSCPFSRLRLLFHSLICYFSAQKLFLIAYCSTFRRIMTSGRLYCLHTLGLLPLATFPERSESVLAGLLLPSCSFPDRCSKTTCATISAYRASVHASRHLLPKFLPLPDLSLSGAKIMRHQPTLSRTRNQAT